MSYVAIDRSGDYDDEPTVRFFHEVSDLVAFLTQEGEASQFWDVYHKVDVQDLA